MKFNIPVLVSIDRIYSLDDIRAGQARKNMIIISMIALSVIAMIAAMIAARIMG